MLPPPTRLSTAAASTWPVTESVTLASACAEPTKAYVPVAAYFSVASARACGMTMETDRRTGMAPLASSSATWTFMTLGPGWSTTWNFVESCCCMAWWK